MLADIGALAPPELYRLNPDYVVPIILYLGPEQIASRALHYWRDPSEPEPSRPRAIASPSVK
jgi:hypothetical protein